MLLPMRRLRMRFPHLRIDIESIVVVAVVVVAAAAAAAAVVAAAMTVTVCPRNQVSGWRLHHWVRVVVAMPSFWV